MIAAYILKHYLILNSISKSLVQEANDSRNITQVRGGLLTAQIGFHF